jgi:hypothetical protein
MRAVVFGSKVIAAIMLTATISWAQAPAPGDKVRLSAEGIAASPVVGVLAPSTADSLRVALAYPGVIGRDTITVARSAVRQLDVSEGKRRHTLDGLRIGVLSGAVVGAALGAATYSPCHQTGLLGCYLTPRSRGESALYGAAAGTVLGLIIGPIAGALTVTDRWRSVPVK